METATVLRRARARIADRARWCQGALARSATGGVVPVRSRSAVRWCALGALHRAAPSLDMDNAAWLLLEEVALDLFRDDRGESFGSVDAVNDNLGHEAVLLLFETAIAVAEGRTP